MNRLQKKCFIASAGLHLLLVLVLLVGPAFGSSRSKMNDVPLIDFIPVKTVDGIVSGGGNRNAPLPAALTRPPAPPAPEATPPRPTPVEPAKDDPPSLEPARHRVVPDLRPTVRNPNASANTKRPNTTQRDTGDRSREIAAEIGRTVRGIRGGLADSTSIELKGPGGGGVPYANWLSAVKSRYTEGGIVPDGIADDSATVTVTVTIARSGMVVSSSIVNRSGNPDVDQSVQMTLDRVRYAAPLPDTATESQRTVTIDFNLRAKLSR